MTSSGVESKHGLLVGHVVGARDSFAAEHPRVDRAELDELVDYVSAMDQPDSGWQVAGQRVKLAGGASRYLISVKTVFSSQDHPNQIVVGAKHPFLIRDYLDRAYKSDPPDDIDLAKALTSWDVGGKPWINVASLKQGRRRPLAVAKFGYDSNRREVVTRVGTQVIPDGHTTIVSHEMPVVDFGRVLKIEVDTAMNKLRRP